MEGFEKVAHLYEKAVREEPDFHLPYLNLATHNLAGSETKNYWVELGFNKIQDDAELGFRWAQEKFFRKEYKELASDKRIGKLKFQNEDLTGMIDGRSNYNKFLISAKYLQEISGMILNGSH